MISLILPFWQRQAVTDESLRLMAGHYLDDELEIIVVDDGSPDRFLVPRWLPLDIRCVRLPKKSGPLNPCVPYNRGVAEAKGEFIALSNPEVMHDKPVLQSMRNDIEAVGEDAYVMAAAWCDEQQRWHAHSSRKHSEDNDVGSYVPRETSYHFMTMMKKSMWEKAGGFDEDYRLGAGYDDPDFLMRLDRAGARFIQRDDLVVRHVRSNARAEWTAPMFARNRAIFLSKWEKKEAAA